MKADQATCDTFEKDPQNNPAPLFDCDQVPDRLQTAQANVEELEIINKDLNSELDIAEAQLSSLEDERAAAHAEEQQTAAALEVAKAAAAALGCHLHA